jgi:hypothetical protein
MDLDPATRDDLIARAKSLASERGWTWLEPVHVSAGAEHGEPAWVVRSHYMAMGVNVIVVFRRSDLAVLRSGYLPR